MPAAARGGEARLAAADHEHGRIAILVGLRLDPLVEPVGAAEVAAVALGIAQLARPPVGPAVQLLERGEQRPGPPLAVGLDEAHDGVGMAKGGLEPEDRLDAVDAGPLRAGTVGGLKPGDAGYAAAAQAAAYQLGTGGTSLNGPGYGNYAQNLLVDVDAGDFVAMMLVNQSHGQTYCAFSQANPDGQGHLWNYGLNTWGWEDTLGGGDHDFNDMIVQLDFTSTAGSGWLI